MKSKDTKPQQRVEFEIAGVNFGLDIVEFKPEIYTDYNIRLSGAVFNEKINGTPDNDGITGFRTLVFPEICHYHTAECKITLLKNFNFADPVLLWSMLREKNQTILRHIHDVYRIGSIDTLRRVFGPDVGCGGYREALLAIRGEDGIWSPINRWLKPEGSRRERTMCLI